MRKSNIIFIISVLIMILPYYSFSYINPGDIMVVAQVVIGGVAGILIALKMFWQNIVNFITGKKPEVEVEPAEQTEKITEKKDK